MSYLHAGSVADPHRKNADTDPEKNLNADAEWMRIHALTEPWRAK
jgi:hypothetical protein